MSGFATLAAPPPSPASPVRERPLAVERSLTGRAWRLRPASEDAIADLRRQHGVDDTLARVMVGRGIDAHAAGDWLNPTLRALLPDPSHLLDMDRAAARLADAVERRERVAIFGDYDVDGATASATLARYLTSLGASARIYIPDRIAEGYGPNAVAMRTLAEEGARLLVTVDCGTTAFTALEAARDAGLETIVLDHHLAEETLPPALAIVNPNRRDQISPLGRLCAAGVVFVTLVAVNRALRRRGAFGPARAEPDLFDLLDLVALGTVADVMPLTGLNRAFVARGLALMAGRRRPGLAALADVARMSGPPTAHQLGFLLGPRVNAGGRVGAAEVGARLLTTEDAAEARDLATRLDGWNRERQAIETETLAAAEAQVEEWGWHDAPAIVVAGRDWHPGVIGLVAARLKERHARPACAVALDAAGVGKGSGRSCVGVNLGAAVVAARSAGLLTAGGGHEMAAGFTVPEAQLPAFRAFLGREVLRQLGGPPRRDDLTLDLMLTVGGATAALVAALARLEPFGTGNPEPRVALLRARVGRAERMGHGHMRVSLQDAGGGPWLKAVAFRAADSALGRALLEGVGAPLHVAGRLRRDEWRGGDAVELHLEDAAEPAG